MKSGVEYRDLGDLGAEYFCTCVDALEMSGVVQGCERRKLFDLRVNVSVDEYAAVKICAALYDSVTDSGNLGEVCDSAVLLVEESFLDGPERLGVVLHFCFALDLLTVVCLEADERAVGADSLTVSLCEHALVCHIDELILQRGAACVDN